MKLRKYILMMLLLLSWAIYGQQKQNGYLKIEADPKIDNLVQMHIAYNKAFPIMPGYRIQIFMESGNEALSQAETVKEKFTEKFSDEDAYLIFAAPYYRVRVGDFRTRIEAEKFLQKISKTYPNAWVIKDEINFPELSNYQKTIENE
jgi:hypothetical protein